VKAFDREVGINLKTAVMMSQAAVDELAKTHGSIVNVSSIAYFQPTPNMAIYAAAKAGVAGFTRSLAAELLPRAVRVNALAPAMVRTPENVDAAGSDATYVEMQHITDGIMFLASSAAEAINGLVLPITRGAV
jgi:NAD(P)-dependent dehydrogenase (short-subunit alcohol dehydrogenase family)